MSALIDKNLDYLFLVFFVSVRLGAMFMSMPLFAEVKISPLVLVILPISMATLIAPLLTTNLRPMYLAQSTLDIFFLFATEFLAGVFMGFSLNLILVLATIVGELTGSQAGLSLASMFDPNLGQMPLLGFFLRNMFLWMFFAFNVHHVFIWVLTQSYTSIPLGTGVLSFTQLVPGLIKLFSMLFVLAFRMVLPIIVVIFLSHLSMGIISITSPQMNIYFNAAIAMNVVIAFILFAIGMPTLGDFFHQMTEQLYLFLKMFLMKDLYG